ncbi:hypothetical protein UFOVP736_73 [uncultured Caudovirales phage]|uniref:Uncharacterized protein n=1 Tax=uncultured Caudovirales phage TaxID=2100421 RepID=A0A6J5NIF7_9CAUD|nr:hypothetical protein UFOVP705_8 [uncultured Caudovirales phage]CAB5224414.1 hypothetical protein UFOVP736_73 [uncultured Caudovirales phage]
MHALLIRLRLATITTSRKDKYITDATIAANGAAADAGRWVNTLWPADALRPIRTAEANLRAHTYQKTSPFSDTGERLLPSAKFFDFMEKYRALESERAAKTQEFLDRYDHWLREAAAMRGTLNNPDDYPTVSEAARSFRCTLEHKALPAVEHLPDELRHVEELKASVQSQIDEGIATAKRDISMRIIKPLEAFLDRAHSDPSTITAATVKPIGEIADIVADLDFDGTYTATIAALRALHLDPAALRTEDWHLSQAKRAVDDILTNFLP